MADTIVAGTNLADRLAEALRLAGISQREASRLAGAKRSYAGLIVRGQRKRPEAEPLLRLAKVLGVSVDWLLTGAGDPPTKRRVQNAVARARKSAPSASVAA